MYMFNIHTTHFATHHQKGQTIKIINTNYFILFTS